MKRPQPDIGDTLRASFLNNVSTTKKMKRLWGTTTVNGVEVLVPRQYHYPANLRSDNFEKLYRFLGSYEDVTASDYAGVERAWLYLNKNKHTDISIDYKNFVADNLNQLWWDIADGTMPAGLTLTTSIAIEVELTTARHPQVVATNLLNPTWSEAQLIQAISDNYESIWDTCLITQQGVGVINKGSATHPISGITTPDEDDLSPNDPWLKAISRYALRDQGLSGTIIRSVEIGLGLDFERVYNTYVVTLEIPYNFFSPSELFIEQIAADLSATYTPSIRNRLVLPNAHWTKHDIKALRSNDLEDPDVITRPYTAWEDIASELDSLYDSLWMSYEGVWYLRADPLSNPRNYGITFKQLSSYILQLIDSDFKKKKVPWWKKLIAIAVFIFVFVASGGTAGGGAIAFAKAILAASLTITLIAAVLNAAGETEWAMAFAEASKTMEPLVKVAQIIMLADFLNKGIEKLGETVLDGEGLGDLLQDKLESYADSLLDGIEQGLKDIMSGDLLSDASLKLSRDMMKIVNKLQELKLEQLNDRNKDLKAEYEGMMAELNNESDILQGFARIYAKPATADWSMYAATFDHPYERGGGNLALGNVQRTTKQAIRKADYGDPAFDNILVI